MSLFSWMNKGGKCSKSELVILLILVVVNLLLLIIATMSALEIRPFTYWSSRMWKFGLFFGCVMLFIAFCVIIGIKKGKCDGTVLWGLMIGGVIPIGLYAPEWGRQWAFCVNPKVIHCATIESKRVVKGLRHRSLYLNLDLEVRNRKLRVTVPVDPIEFEGVNKGDDVIYIYEYSDIRNGHIFVRQPWPEMIECYKRGVIIKDTLRYEPQYIDESTGEWKWKDIIYHTIPSRL